MNPDVKMKDSGVEWIGEIPEEWEPKRLRFIGSYKNSNVDKKSYEDQKPVRLCNYTDVYYNEKITNNLEFMESTASDNEIDSMTLKRGDIIITKDSEDPHDIGIPAIVSEDLDNVVCGYHLTVIRTPDLATANYLFRAIQGDISKAQFYVESPGVTRFGLNQETIGSLWVALPPIELRLILANFLDKQTNIIDSLISKTEESINLLKEKRSALITAAVTGKIDVREEA
jgi:type I restriction enzyme S subunit